MCDFSRDLKVAWLAHDRTSGGRLFQRVEAETEKASEAKSDLTNGMTSKALVEDLNVLYDILSLTHSPGADTAVALGDTAFHRMYTMLITTARHCSSLGGVCAL